ncbi:MAG: arylsulfatase [Steroidobacteraceae bacterium]
MLNRPGLHVVACGLLLNLMNPSTAMGSESTSVQSEGRPNVLLIVVDDMGHADLGSFGGEIPTPNLDALAQSGIRLSRFITAAACSPTRAMLLTGVDAHRAGLGNLEEELAPNQRNQPGYEGYLNERVVTVPTLLREAGYRTYMTGKWHLGTEEQHGPAARGFDRSFAMLTNASHFADMRPAYSPDPLAKAKYRDEGHLISELPRNFDYSSQYFVDRMIEYLDSDQQQPFFAYLAFSAPHWPLQAPDESIARFAGRYDEGPDAIAEARLRRQIDLGLVQKTARLAPRAPKGRPWGELDEQTRRVEARAMEVYAAMIFEIDRHVGRLMDHLRASNRLDNTVVIFLSDNGAEGHDYDDTWPAEAFPAIRKVLDEAHDFSLENMGRPGSYTFYGPNWARASSPALGLYKAFPTEGGVRTAAFVSGTGRFGPARIEDALVLAKDLAPTILDLAGVVHPGNRHGDRDIEPMSGVSALAILQGRATDQAWQQRIHADELLGKRSVRLGDWKLVHMPAPFGSGAWQLYDLANDLAESRDLAQQHPDKLAELIAYWESYAQQNGVILPDWVSGY